MKSSDAFFLGRAAAYLFATLMLVAPPLGASNLAEVSGAVQSHTVLAQAGIDASTFTYYPNRRWYTATPDLRLCPSPMCGGYWVTRVNKPFTICANGTRAPSCYVATLDLAELELSTEQQGRVRMAAGHLLLQGTIESGERPPFADLGVFRATEAWIGHSRVTASGTFYRARNTGIVCVTFPCPTHEAAMLNRVVPPRTIAGVDLSGVSASPSDGLAQLNEPQGLMVAGNLVPVSGPAGTSSQLVATEYYLPVLADTEYCGSLGLPACTQGEFCDFPPKANCGRADAPGMCEVRPQACTTQFDPVCGCDGVTYSNECVANAAGVSVEYKGACGNRP